jgi:hypothetical protein
LTSLSVKVDGAIEFTDDDRDVKSLSPGGHFRMEEGTWLSGRRYDVKADSAGNLTKTYSVGSSVKPLDSDGTAMAGAFAATDHSRQRDWGGRPCRPFTAPRRSASRNQ